MEALLILLHGAVHTSNSVLDWVLNGALTLAPVLVIGGVMAAVYLMNGRDDGSPPGGEPV